MRKTSQRRLRRGLPSCGALPVELVASTNAAETWEALFGRFEADSADELGADRIVEYETGLFTLGLLMEVERKRGCVALRDLA
jgi:hypothetical protein